MGGTKHSQRIFLMNENYEESCNFIRYDMIYYLTAVGLTPGDSSTVHIDTQTIHRTTEWNRIHRDEHTLQ